MGYYSNIVMVFDHKINIPSEVTDVIQVMGGTKKMNTLAVYYFIDGIKWYSNFSDVKIIEDYILELSNEDSELFGFSRIGEEIGDFESHGEPYNYGVDFVTYIDVPEFVEEKYNL